MTGFFISFEGIDRSGKSTQAKLLYEHLRAANQNCLLTREPGGGGSLSLKLRELLLDRQQERSAMTSALLFAAARSEHVATIIRPALKAGTMVICDRFVDSTAAYQGGGEGLGRADLMALANLATGGLIPDLTFLLQISHAERLQRNGKHDYYDPAAGPGRGAFMDRVAASYQDLASTEPERIVSLDGSLPIGQLTKTICAHVKRRS